MLDTVFRAFVVQKGLLRRLKSRVSAKAAQFTGAVTGGSLLALLRRCRRDSLQPDQNDQSRGVQHGWVGGPIIQMLAAHLKLQTERPPIMEATTGSCGITGIEPSPDYDIFLNLPQCGIRGRRRCPLREIRVKHDATGPPRNSAWYHGGGPRPSRRGTTALRNDRIAR
jgi:hypothetical protein